MCLVGYVCVCVCVVGGRGTGWLVLLLPCFTENPVFDVNSVDPDQTRVLWSLIWIHAV